MAQETYDWSLDYSDEQNGGTTTFTSSTGDTVDITVSQPDPGGDFIRGGDGFETSTQGGSSSGYFAMQANFDNTADTLSTTIDFSSNSVSGQDSVTDPSFTLYDLDSPTNASYQDQVTILAYDSAGNLLPVTLTATDPSVVSVSGSTATAIVGGGSSSSGNVLGSSTEGNVQVSISGEVSQIVVVYGSGPDAASNPSNQYIGISDLTFDVQPAIDCFVSGTMVLTPEGQKPVEELVPGDLVITADHGAQPVRWAGSARVAGKGRLAPVRFSPGTIGNEKELLVSPNHRVLVSGWLAEYYTGHEEVLVAAKHLVNGSDIVRIETETVEYIHLMFDRHEVVYADGAPCESLFLSAQSLRGMGHEGRSEIEALFPELLDNPALFGTTARPCLREFEAKLVA